MGDNTLEHALKLHQEGRLREAAAVYRTLLETEPTNVRALELLAMLEAQQGQLQKAIQLLLQALAMEPLPSLYNNLGNLYLQQQAWQPAQKAFKQALALDPNYANAAHNLGNLFYRQQDLTQAEQYYQQAATLDPGFADPHFNLGLLYCKQNQLDKALTALQKAVALDPQHARALGQLAQIHLTQENYETATELLKKRLKLQPQHIESWHSLGQAQLQLEQFDNAIDSFKECLSHNAKHPQANHDLANALTHSGDHSSALSFYYRQIEINPLPESYYNIGVLLMYQERPKEAAQYLEQTLKLEPGNVPAHINLASIYLKLNEPTKAGQHYEHALKHDPDNAEIRHILAAIRQQDIPTRAPAQYLENLFNQYAHYYDKHLMEILHYQVPQHLKQIVLAQTDRTNLRILDLGCGTGICGAEFKNIAQYLVGVDLSVNMINIAKQKNIYDALHVQDIESYLPKEQNLDIIIAGDVFTYIGDLRKIFSLCCNSLKPQGMLGFSVERTTSKDYILQQSIRYAHHKDYIQQCLETNGFSIVNLEPLALREQQRKPVPGYIVLAKRR